MSSGPELRTYLPRESKDTCKKDSDIKMELSHLPSYIIQDPVPYDRILACEGMDLTINELADLGDDCLGLVVLLTSSCSSVSLGVISYLLKRREKIVLEKVINPRTKKINLGLRTFFFYQVSSIEVLGIDEEAKHRLTKESAEKCQGKKLLRNKTLPIEVKGRHGEDEVLEVTQALPHHSQVQAASLPKKPNTPPSQPPSPSPPPSPAKIPRPSQWLLIDTLDDAYMKAILMINKEAVISVGHSCTGYGRGGTLVWLSVATSSMIFHFDVAKMGGGEAMDAGLGRVLQDKGLVKVMHDCRPLEDLLHHQFKINLTNVYDTQATEIYLHLQYKQEEMPRLVSTLPSLLKKYLNFTPPHSLLGKVDSSLLTKRPLEDSVGERLAMDIMYLREVRLEQLNLMLADLRHMTEVYMGTMRDKDSASIEKMEPQLVPPEILRVCNISGGTIKDEGIPFVPRHKGRVHWK